MADQVFEADPLNIKKEIDQELLLLEKTFDSKLEELYKSPEKSILDKHLPKTRPKHNEETNLTQSPSCVATPPAEESVRIKTEPPSPRSVCSTSLVDESIGTQTTTGVVVESEQENNDHIDSIVIKAEPPSPQVTPIKSNVGNLECMPIPLCKEEIKDEFDSDYELYEINQGNDCFDGGSEDGSEPDLALDNDDINDAVNITAEQNMSQIEITVSIFNKQPNRKRKISPENVGANKRSNVSESPQLQNYHDEPLGVLLNLVDPKKWKSKSSLNSSTPQKSTNNERNDSRPSSLLELDKNKTNIGDINKPVRRLRSGKNIEIDIDESTSKVDKLHTRAGNRLGKRKRNSLTSSVEDEFVSKRSTLRNTSTNKKEFKVMSSDIIKGPIESNVKSILKKSSSVNSSRKEGAHYEKKAVHFASIESENNVCDNIVISDNDDNNSVSLTNLPDLLKDSLAVQNTSPLVNRSIVNGSPSDVILQTDNTTSSIKNNNKTRSNSKNKIMDYYKVRNNDMTLPDNNKDSGKKKPPGYNDSNEINVEIEAGVKSKVSTRKQKVELKITKGGVKGMNEVSVAEPNVTIKKQNSILEVQTNGFTVNSKVTGTEPKKSKEKQNAEPATASGESSIVITDTELKGRRKTKKVQPVVTREEPKVTRQKHKVEANRLGVNLVVESAVAKKKQKNELSTTTKKPDVDLCVNQKKSIEEVPVVPSKQLKVLHEDEIKHQDYESEVAQKNTKYECPKKSTEPVAKICKTMQQDTEQDTVDKSTPEKKSSGNAIKIKKEYARKSTGPVPNNGSGPGVITHSQPGSDSNSQVKGSNNTESRAKVNKEDPVGSSNTKSPVLAYLCICGEWCKTGQLLSGHLKDCRKLQPKVCLPKVKIPS